MKQVVKSLEAKDEQMEAQLELNVWLYCLV